MVFLREISTHPLARSQCNVKSGMEFTVKGETYTVGGRIGDGAAGIVRKATRRRDQNLFAVKFLAPDPKYLDEYSFEDVAARFIREGKRGAELEHHNLLKIHSYCENSNGSSFTNNEVTNPFIVMEYIHGKTLEQIIRAESNKVDHQFDITESRLKIAIQIASALEHLHRRRVVHRDIKPANIFVSQNRDQNSDEFDIRVGDFGIVKWGEFHRSLATGTLTATNQDGLGTMKYMSPEQAISPKDVTAKSDIYSLGITLFELFTNEILASPHHVYGVMMARLSRGSTVSRFIEMGYSLGSIDESFAGTVLDMLLRGVSGRPSISKIKANLEWEYLRRYDEEYII